MSTRLRIRINRDHWDSKEENSYDNNDDSTNSYFVGLFQYDLIFERPNNLRFVQSP